MSGNRRLIGSVISEDTVVNSTEYTVGYTPPHTHRHETEELIITPLK